MNRKVVCVFWSRTTSAPIPTGVRACVLKQNHLGSYSNPNDGVCEVVVLLFWSRTISAPIPTVGVCVCVLEYEVEKNKNIFYNVKQ